MNGCIFYTRKYLVHSAPCHALLWERVSDLGCEHMTFFQDTYTVNTSQ